MACWGCGFRIYFIRVRLFVRITGFIKGHGGELSGGILFHEDSANHEIQKGQKAKQESENLNQSVPFLGLNT